MSSRSAKSPLRKIPHKPTKRTLAAAAAAVAVAGTVTASMAVGSAGSAAQASTAPAAKIAVSSGGAPQAGAYSVLGSNVGARHQDGSIHLTRADGRAGTPSARGPQSGRPQANGHVRQMLRKAAPPHRPDSCHTGPQVQQWVCQAEAIMVAHGTPRSAVDTAAGVIVAVHESGGNPSASNGWDSNAAAGTPSQGIAQVIGPTFATYHLPGHNNIWNPVDNMIAAFRYAVGRYGSMGNIPGVVAVRSGGTYVGY